MNNQLGHVLRREWLVPGEARRGRRLRPFRVWLRVGHGQRHGRYRSTRNYRCEKRNLIARRRRRRRRRAGIFFLATGCWTPKPHNTTHPPLHLCFMFYFLRSPPSLGVSTWGAATPNPRTCCLLCCVFSLFCVLCVILATFFSLIHRIFVELRKMQNAARALLALAKLAAVRSAVCVCYLFLF